MSNLRAAQPAFSFSKQFLGSPTEELSSIPWQSAIKCCSMNRKYVHTTLSITSHTKCEEVSTTVFFFSYFTQNSRNKVFVASQARSPMIYAAAGPAGMQQGGLSGSKNRKTWRAERGERWAGCHFPLIISGSRTLCILTSGTLCFLTLGRTLSPWTLYPRWACSSVNTPAQRSVPSKLVLSPYSELKHDIKKKEQR